jgi:hypothetical protein
MLSLLEKGQDEDGNEPKHVCFLSEGAARFKRCAFWF